MYILQGLEADYMRETGSLLARLSVPIRPRSENSFCITRQKSIKSINELKADEK